MRYREFHPKSPLNTVVECFWTLESETDDLAATPERILPDGCVELILNFGTPFQQHIDKAARLQPRNFVVGQMTGPIVIAPTGPAQVIGIRFHPGGTTPFFSVPMHELTDQIVELGSIASRLEQSLATCGDIRSIAGKVTALESILTHQLQRTESDLRLLQVARTMVVSGGMITVDSLASAAGISSRQLERKFLNEVGVGPKTLSRILRFQQVFRAVESNQFSWPSIAVECGYYDQAHLIRDFRQFAQETPSTLFAESSPLTESFTRKTRMSNFSNTPHSGNV